MLCCLDCNYWFLLIRTVQAHENIVDGDDMRQWFSDLIFEHINVHKKWNLYIYFFLILLW